MWRNVLIAHFLLRLDCPVPITVWCTPLFVPLTHVSSSSNQPAHPSTDSCLMFKFSHQIWRITVRIKHSYIMNQTINLEEERVDFLIDLSEFKCDFSCFCWIQQLWIRKIQIFCSPSFKAMGRFVLFSFDIKSFVFNQRACNIFSSVSIFFYPHKLITLFITLSINCTAFKDNWCKGEKYFCIHIMIRDLFLLWFSKFSYWSSWEFGAFMFVAV